MPAGSAGRKCQVWGHRRLMWWPLGPVDVRFSHTTGERKGVAADSFIVRLGVLRMAFGIRNFGP